MTREQLNKKKIPDAPGVYFFLGHRKEILYIGKAASLRDRLRSYFVPDLADVRSPLVASAVAKAKTIDWRQTDTVLEALFLEANLIKSYKPKGNTDAKDDKSWNYVVITKEDFPRVLLVRSKVLESEFPKNVRLQTFGPFPHGGQLKDALKLVRKIFPYRDTCMPGQGRPCFNRQLGLCPGVCTGEANKTEYRKTVRHIALFLGGKKKQLLATLKKEMKSAAKAEDFECAKELRRQLFALQHIQDVSLIKEEYRSGETSNRIEAYDAAHLQGSAAVGVMTVVEDGLAHKSEYRKFRLRATAAGDDAGALREVLSRRLGHDEWPLPKLIVVDGAAAQMNAAERVLEEYGIGIPVVGVVKDESHRPREIRGSKGLSPELQRYILLANAEAHRFAIGYHRRSLRQRS